MAYFIQPSDYSSDRSASDRARHREKIRENIKENIADIISEEAIIGKSGDRVIKIPIRGIKEYRFVYSDNIPGAGQGEGDTKPGDVVGEDHSDGSPMGDKAGNQPGEDYYETEITIDELIDILFEDLELPHLERKKFRFIESTRLLKPKGTKKVGIRARLHRKKTAIQRIKRKLSTDRILNGENTDEAESVQPEQTGSSSNGCQRAVVGSSKREEEERFPFHKDDLRYKRLDEDVKEESNAVVICIMDTSGSMDSTKKFLARSFYFLLYQFVKLKYRNTELVFIGHHTSAREVNEQEFFHKGESGGTLISSGYNKALEIIKSRFHPSLWNIYAFHCSDGDNWTSDNPAAIKAATELTTICNLFGYGEIKPGRISTFESSMFKVFEPVKAENFVKVKITRKSEIWPAFKTLMSADRDSK